MSQPPPLPERSPPPLAYAQPHRQPPPHEVDGGTQRVFDTVVGPNLRLRDNLIQLACVVIGTAAGAMIGRMFEQGSGGAPMMLFGAFGGLVGSLLISGLVIGIVRMVGVARQRRRRRRQ